MNNTIIRSPKGIDLLRVASKIGATCANCYFHHNHKEPCDELTPPDCFAGKYYCMKHVFGKVQSYYFIEAYK
jgi:hypothetical protein